MELLGGKKKIMWSETKSKFQLQLNGSMFTLEISIQGNGNRSLMTNAGSI